MNQLQKNIVKNKAAKAFRKRNKSAMSLTQSKSMILLGTATKRSELEQYNEMTKDWKHKYQPIQIKTFVFVSEGISFSELEEIIMLNKSNFSLLIKPKKDEFPAMFDKQHDILIDTSVDGNYYLLSLMAELKYKFSIGCSANKFQHLLDVVFVDKKLNLSSFKNNTEKYLAK